MLPSMVCYDFKSIRLSGCSNEGWGGISSSQLLWNGRCQGAIVSDGPNWLTSDSSKFGILLCDECGNGKSTLLNAFQQLQNFLSIPNPDGQGNYGIQITDKYVTCLGRTDYKAFIQLMQKEMLGIDDLGTEPQEVMDFGNIVTSVIDLLTKRYDEQLFTIITTNLTPKEIREHYGGRIAYRLNEMVEKIVFKNDSYRTDK